MNKTNGKYPLERIKGKRKNQTATRRGKEISTVCVSCEE